MHEMTGERRKLVLHMFLYASGKTLGSPCHAQSVSLLTFSLLDGLASHY